MAAKGWLFVNCPLTSSNPRGVFIQALAMVTNTAEASPLIETITPAVRWANCENECATRQQLRQLVEVDIMQHTCSISRETELERVSRCAVCTCELDVWSQR